jgi:hypothetical protein
MKILLKIVSFAGLALTVVPSFLVFSGSLKFSAHTTIALIGTILWFVSAPFWMKSTSDAVD